MTTKTVEIDGEDYDLKKTLRLSGKEISLDTTTITIDEDGGIDSSDSSSRLAHSKSRISLHGIEVPSSLFPETWSMQKNQVSLAWPIPILLVVDICGSMDLDLNSSRTQILMSDKWIKLEEALAKEILLEIFHSVKEEYWEDLKHILLEESKSEAFFRSLNNINPVPV